MATPQQVAQSQALIEQQAEARSRAAAAAIALAMARVRAFDQWYSGPAITAWAISLARDIEVIQRSYARQMDMFLARAASITTGRVMRPVGAVSVTNLRNGITHAGEYGRVADAFRYQQSLFDGGKTGIVRPIEVALLRASDIADTDVTLAMRAQSQKFMLAQTPAPEQPAPISEAHPTGEPEDQPSPDGTPPKGKPRLIGVRRIVHPELSKGGSCGMCIAASTRIYYREDLQPMHQGCNCLPWPVYEGDKDPGGIINERDLVDFYDNAGSNLYLPLRNTRYQINDHGELGPVLDRYGAAFRKDPDAVRRAEKASRSIPRKRR